jgi:hypothetical protein
MTPQEPYFMKSYRTDVEPMDTKVNQEATGIETNTIEFGQASLTEGTVLNCNYFNSCYCQYSFFL